MKIKINSIKAQIWVETVIYTLIGLTIIAILLSIAMPQIEKMKDRGVITQTTDALNILNSKILEAEESQGSIRIVNLKIARGKLEINSKENKIVYSLEKTPVEITQIGEAVKEGDIIIETNKTGNKFDIFLTMDYNNTLNITYNGKEESKIMQGGTSPYKIMIENKGFTPPARKINLNFNVD